jgi:hypothetical protein
MIGCRRKKGFSAIPTFPERCAEKSSLVELPRRSGAGREAKKYFGNSMTRWRFKNHPIRFAIVVCKGCTPLIFCRTAEGTRGNYRPPETGFAQPNADQSKLWPSKVPSTTTYAARSVEESENATSNGTPCRTRYRQSIRTGCRASFPHRLACRRPGIHL